MKGRRITLIAVVLLALPFVAGAAQTRTQTRTQARSGGVRPADAVSDCKDQQATTLAQQQAEGHDPYGLDKKCPDPVPPPPPNQPPAADFTSTCNGLDCNFASTSSDPDGSVASYAWTFGDGGTSTLPTPSHSYATGGSYPVSLTVTDNQGALSSPISKMVAVTAPPPPPPPPPPSSVPPSGINGAQGTVYEDIDGNGSRDPFAGEMGLAGWTVQLYWSGQVLATATTDADGNFSFGGLGNGAGASYEVCIVPQAGYVQTSTPPPDRAGCGGSGWAFSFNGAFQQVAMPLDFGMQAIP